MDPGIESLVVQFSIMLQVALDMSLDSFLVYF